MQVKDYGNLLIKPALENLYFAIGLDLHQKEIHLMVESLLCDGDKPEWEFYNYLKILGQYVMMAATENHGHRMVIIPKAEKEIHEYVAYLKSIGCKKQWHKMNDVLG